MPRLTSVVGLIRRINMKKFLVGVAAFVAVGLPAGVSFADFSGPINGPAEVSAPAQAPVADSTCLPLYNGTPAASQPYYNGSTRDQLLPCHYDAPVAVSDPPHYPTYVNPAEVVKPQAVHTQRKVYSKKFMRVPAIVHGRHVMVLKRIYWYQ